MRGKDPSKAISLVWADINAGHRVDSALKDMAVVMIKLNRPKEAIEANLIFSASLMVPLTPQGLGYRLGSAQEDVQPLASCLDRNYRGGVVGLDYHTIRHGGHDGSGLGWTEFHTKGVVVDRVQDLFGLKPRSVRLAYNELVSDWKVMEVVPEGEWVGYVHSVVLSLLTIMFFLSP